MVKLTAVLKASSALTADMSGRVERQELLQPQHRIEKQETRGVEQQHGDRIGEPMLLALLVDAGDPVKRHLDRPQDWRQESTLAVEHTRHVPAQRQYERGDERAIDQNLNPAIDGHGMP